MKILNAEQNWAWHQDSLEVESSEADLVSAVPCRKLRFISLKCAAQAVVREGINKGLRSTSG